MRCIIILLLCLPLLLIAQTKRDNTIIINGYLSSKSIATLLFQNGYSIVSNDSTFINTTSKAVPKTSVSVKLMFLKSDTTLIIKGLFKSVISLSIGGAKIEDDFTPIELRGMKGSEYYQAWQEMVRIANLLSPNVTYQKQ